MKKGTLKKAFITACAAGATLFYPSVTNHENYTPPADLNHHDIVLNNDALTDSLIQKPQFITNDQTASICNSALQEDTHGIEWIKVKAITKDGIDIEFNLTALYDSSNLAKALDKSLCLNLKDEIFHHSKLMYEQEILNVEYSDLPSRAASIASRVITKTEQQINAILSKPQLEIKIHGLAINNVSAPGLNKPQGKALLEGRLHYNQAQLDAPYIIEATSKDNQKVSFEVDFLFQPKQEAYNVMGPNKEGIKRNIVSSLTDIFKRHAASWHSDCISENAQYFRDTIYTDAAVNSELSNFIYLTDLDINKINIPDLKLKDNGASGHSCTLEFK
jgi:hypothetical protein